MESITSLIPESSQRSTEDRLLIATVMRCIADYLKAVMDFGPDFFFIPMDQKFRDGKGGTKARTREYRVKERRKTMACGKIAYQYLFISNESELCFQSVCSTLGFNAATFRHKLKNMTRKEAKKLYGLFIRGEMKAQHIRENGE